MTDKPKPTMLDDMGEFQWYTLGWEAAKRLYETGDDSSKDTYARPLLFKEVYRRLKNKSEQKGKTDDR